MSKKFLPTIHELKYKLKKCYEEQYLLSIELNQNEQFLDKWQGFVNIFQNV